MATRKERDSQRGGVTKSATSRLDRWLEGLENNPITASIIFIGIVIAAIVGFIRMVCGPNCDLCATFPAICMPSAVCGNLPKEARLLGHIRLNGPNMGILEIKNRPKRDVTYTFVAERGSSEENIYVGYDNGRGSTQPEATLSKEARCMTVTIDLSQHQNDMFELSAQFQYPQRATSAVIDVFE